MNYPLLAFAGVAALPAAPQAKQVVYVRDPRVAAAQAEAVVPPT